MNDSQKFGLPPIGDDEICWASQQLSLQGTAFLGEDGADRRADVLRSLEQIDIAACPGSGKTTLLVAKLAILAAKWPYRTRGLCVISHTNVARREIETRLGHTAPGRRLLGHPHFIGTIHGFVNEFLAMPWLHSLGYRVRMIDTESALERRWYSLSRPNRSALERNHHTAALLEARTPDFRVGDVRWGAGLLRADTPLYKVLCEACKKSADEGYFCYDEMFIWAHDLMDHVPAITLILRDRFPLLLLDEAQDTKDEQARILHRIFTAGKDPALCQRFGDGNQAIFDSTQDVGTADPALVFPLAAVQRDLPTSHRFGKSIAKLANPLGLQPQDLVGMGPRIPLASGAADAQHTIYLFRDRDGARQVLPAFGDLILNTFSAEELTTGVFKAIGQVHQNNGDDDFPRHIGHYWPNYDSALSRSEPKPHTFVQYAFAGTGKATAQGASYFAVEKIAEGVLRLASLAIDDIALTEGRDRQRHRRVLRSLRDPSNEADHYHEFMAQFAVHRQPLTRDLWDQVWRAKIQGIAESIAGASLAGAEAQAFLNWSEPLVAEPDAAAAAPQKENIVRYSQGNKDVRISLGSIHSVKGETHTATLVLETFWHAHNLSSIRDWLCARRSGGAGAAPRIQTRLKLHYVAMTRPSHLLCLALPTFALFEKEKDGGASLVQELSQQGWTIREV